MHRAARWTLGTAIAVLIGASAAALLALALAVQHSPSVNEPLPVSVDDVARAHALLLRHDPRTARPGVVQAVALSQRDVELLLDQAGRRFGATRSSVGLRSGSAVLRASVPLPGHLPGGWLNIDARLQSGAGLPGVQALRVGRLPVPAWLARQALPALLDALGLRAQAALALRMVSRVDFQPQRLTLSYAWPDDPRRALGPSLLPAEDLARLKRHVDALAALLAAAPPSGQVEMARLLPPLFALAQRHSADDDQARAENRAALLALALVANRGALTTLVPAARGWAPLRPVQFTLLGRPDFPLHFLISAVIAAEAGGPLSDAIGVYKEVVDARSGSGFSFNDIAADRAGTRLGQRAASSPRALQQRLADGVQESDLMPPVSDLPEYLGAAEFARRFGAVGAPAYREMMAGIEARLDRLPLLGATALR